MSWTLFRATLHQRRTSIFWFSFGLVCYAWMMTWFWPQMGGDTYAGMLESLPPEFLALFGGTDVPFASLGGYFQVEYLGLMWILIVAAAVILFAGKAFSGEVAAGTMEFVLAQPISRARFAITRVVSLVGYCALLAAASFVPIQVFGPRYEIDLSAETFWTLCALGFVFMLAVGGIAMLLSAFARGTGLPGAVSAGLLVVMWVLDLIAGVSEFAEAFDPVNLVTYWQPGKIINGGAVPAEAWWVYAGVALVTLAASVVVFMRRDVA